MDTDHDQNDIDIPNNPLVYYDDKKDIDKDPEDKEEIMGSKDTGKIGTGGWIGISIAIFIIVSFIIGVVTKFWWLKIHSKRADNIAKFLSQGLT